MRRKQVELEAAVIAAARAWSAAAGTFTFRAQADLDNAIAALDAYAVTQIPTRTGAYNEGGGETQRAAALAAVHLGTVRRAIVNELYQRRAERYVTGFTDDELEHHLKRKHTTVSSARNSLVESGWVTDSGLVRKTPSGRDATCWILTPAAIEHLNNWSTT